jgi:hypothetical protein
MIPIPMCAEAFLAILDSRGGTRAAGGTLNRRGTGRECDECARGLGFAFVRANKFCHPETSTGEDPDT